MKRCPLATMQETRTIGEYDEIVSDILSHFEMDEIPETWSIAKMEVE